MEDKDEIIEMALSDKVPFDTIKQLYGLDENQVKRIMKAELKPGSFGVGASAWSASRSSAVPTSKQELL